ncbi:peptidyl-prolyl cis-trans isomerase [Falsihalocynthiibacter arcticus]|uniref:Parvulin-like PPIase n=1 Tax=Falsihalocynthiibacter arcticus TaxID=1579316 RepID=A0A126V554_9RHOB|nr:peptidylprolyl isomerase [Falsihalocynthiibacter arcticus]AML53403.1 hypothetical protein RC74_21005 [Falsihalocynthiibacter arcticus]
MTSNNHPDQGTFAKLLRDPFVHFALGGLVVFAAWYAFKEDEVLSRTDDMVIEITEGDLRQIGVVMMSQGRDLPSPDQMRELAHQEALQRVLAREAIALGLDQNDEIISRRLAQKMDFLLTDLAALTEPTADELKEWYADNADLFALPPRVSFSHLYFSQDERGLEGAKTAAEGLLPDLANTNPYDPDLKGAADRFMFHDYYGGRAPDDIAREFGPSFAQEVFALPSGSWQGPIRSGYGWHLVWVDTLEQGNTAPFETVEDDVRAAWLQDRYLEIRDRAYDEMLSRYEIVMADPESVSYSPAQGGDNGAFGQ